MKCFQNKNNVTGWGVVVLGWQSGRFRYQRSVVRIQSTARFYNENIFCKLLKRQKQEKSGQEWPNKR